MAKAYFTLVSRLIEHGVWAPQFGDYDRETVEFEMADMKAADRLDKRPRALYRIVKTPSARQHLVDAALAKLNAGV